MRASEVENRIRDLVSRSGQPAPDWACCLSMAWASDVVQVHHVGVGQPLNMRDGVISRGRPHVSWARRATTYYANFCPWCGARWNVEGNCWEKSEVRS